MAEESIGTEVMRDQVPGTHPLVSFSTLESPLALLLSAGEGRAPLPEKEQLDTTARPLLCRAPDRVKSARDPFFFLTSQMVSRVVSSSIYLSK